MQLGMGTGDPERLLACQSRLRTFASMMFARIHFDETTSENVRDGAEGTPSFRSRFADDAKSKAEECPGVIVERATDGDVLFDQSLYAASLKVKLASPARAAHCVLITQFIGVFLRPLRMQPILPKVTAARGSIGLRLWV